MNEPIQEVRQAVLDLGLEDVIPLPEIADEVRSIRPDVAVEALRTALLALLKEGRIQVWSGRWPDEPQAVDPAMAEELLRDDERYEFNSPADQRLRVYYINVDNLRT